MFAKETYVTRRKALRERVKRGGIILLPGNSDSPRNYPQNIYNFRQDSSFLYFFGHSLPKIVGVMDIDSGKEILFADDLSMDDIIWTGPQPTIKELGERVGVSDTRPFNALREYIQLAIRKGRPIHFTPPYRGENKLLLSSLLGIKPTALEHYISIELALAIVSLRDKKSKEEVAELERACEIGYLMHTTAMKMCRPGIVEREIAGAIEGIALQYGAGTSFPSIVSQNGETLHNHYYGNTLEAGRLLLCDAGAETTTNYCSDFTRTYPVNGKFTQKQKDIYNIVLSAYNRAFEITKPNMTYQEVHLAAGRVLTEGLVDLGLMKGSVDDAVAAGAYAMFMPHGLGHMIGLDVHDMEDIGEKYVGYDLETERSKELGLGSLRMGRRLAEGMVVSVEPGIYFIPAYIKKWKEDGLNTQFINFNKAEEYFGFGGIRIEDDMLITANGNRILGERTVPVTVEQIEEFMADN